MERKIGEIFEYNGEWYQCVECTHGIVDVCKGCSFYTTEGLCSQGINDNILGHCGHIYRVDDKNVIFKKLEKVGEPYEKRVSDGTFSTFQRYRVYNSVILPKEPYVYCNFIDGTIEIEIKQTKEDMEEKKQCGDNRFRAIARAKEHLFQATNIAEDKKELEVLDSFLLRCWQMGWLKQYEDGEEKKLNLKPFDIQKAREGKPVYTRDGRKARILCYDFKQNEEYPILVAVENKDGKECALLYSNDGISEMYKSSNNELAMLPEKKEGWVNIYKEGVDQYIYNNEKAALSRRGSDCIATIKIEWEE